MVTYIMDHPVQVNVYLSARFKGVLIKNDREIADINNGIADCAFSSSVPL